MPPIARLCSGLGSGAAWHPEFGIGATYTFANRLSSGHAWSRTRRSRAPQDGIRPSSSPGVRGASKDSTTRGSRSMLRIFSYCSCGADYVVAVQADPDTLTCGEPSR